MANHLRQKKLAENVGGRSSPKNSAEKFDPMPHEHLRPAGVCAGIAMAGNLFLLLALTKRTIIRQIIILWEKNAMFAGFFEAKLTRFLPEAKGFSLATVHARLAPERLS